MVAPRVNLLYGATGPDLAMVTFEVAGWNVTGTWAVLLVLSASGCPLPLMAPLMVYVFGTLLVTGKETEPMGRSTPGVPVPVQVVQASVWPAQEQPDQPVGLTAPPTGLTLLGRVTVKEGLVGTSPL